MEIDFPRIHNILDLANAVKRLGFEPNISDEDAIFLNSVYRSRYPCDLSLLSKVEPTKGDAEKALTIARELSDWMENIYNENTKLKTNRKGRDTY